jgi:hypothetical protein
MSVKLKDRHLAKKDCLQKSRELINYILILTRPREYNEEGKQIQKPGLLGEGQALSAFGIDILKCGKRIHACCFNACNIYIKNKETYEARREYFYEAIKYCDSIFRQIDLCIFQYAKNNKKKRNSFYHLSKLNLTMKRSIQDRMNRDKIIYEHNYLNK